MASRGLISFKNLLQEYVQRKRGIPLPQYRTTYAMQMFSCTVAVDGHVFVAQELCPTRKIAEQSAARQACIELGILKKFDNNGSKEEHPRKPSPRDESRGCKTRDKSSVDAERCLVSSTSDSKNQCSSADIKVTPTHEKHCESSSVAAAQRGDEVPLMKMLGQKKIDNLQIVTETLKETVTFSKSHKSALFELCHQHRLELPKYNTYPSRKGGFECEIAFMGRLFNSAENVRFLSKKTAEKNASEGCFAAVEREVAARKSRQEKTPPRPAKSSAEVLPNKETQVDEPGPAYQVILQEYLQQRGFPAPEFECKVTEEGAFQCRCIVGKQKFSFCQACRRKKEARQLAAKVALHGLAGRNLDDIIARWEAHKNKKRRPNPDDLSMSRKSPRLDNERLAPSGLSLHTLQPKVNDVAIIELPDLAVAEIWTELKNVSVIGNMDFSIVMKSQGPSHSIYSLEKLAYIDLQPGVQLIGLQSKYAQRGSNVYLTSSLCRKALVPEEVLPVLISSGVVLIRHENSSPQVLLKRYKFSPMFVQPSASLAQCFRHYYSGKSVAMISIEMLTANLSRWLHSEVEAIAEMSLESIRKLFHHTWKFRQQWATIWEEELPYKLRQLQSSAQSELMRRTGSDRSEDHYRDWGLPKGNLKNRVSSTGVVMESDLDCAIRELREESGIVLKKDDVIGSPYVDIFAGDDDNANPHRGDFTRYFIVVDDLAEVTETVSGEDLDDSHCGLFFLDTSGDASLSSESPPRSSPTPHRRSDIVSSAASTQSGRSSGGPNGTPANRRHSLKAGVASTESPLQTPTPPKHEECQWFPLEIALERSPVLYHVSKSDVFQYHLQTLCPSFAGNVDLSFSV